MSDELGASATQARSRVGRPHTSAPDPVVRNGYALVLATVVTSGTGFFYWVIAARLFNPAQVGRSAAALTAMMLIASVAGMNLTGSLAYLLPRLGRSVRKCVIASYAGSTALALVLAAAFLTVMSVSDTSLAFLRQNTEVAVVFAVGAAGSVVFTLQDGVLIGLRRSSWVLGENAAFAVVKLLALIGSAVWGITNGIFLSWVVPILLAVLVVNVPIFRWLVPRAMARPDELRMTQGVLRRFVGLNYVSALFYQGYFNLLPLLVLIKLGSAANGFFYVVWTITGIVDLVSHSMGASLTVESAAAPDRLAEHTRGISRRLVALLLPAVTVAVAAAPQFLGLYGTDYAGHSTTLLRLLMIGSLPRALVIVAQSATRAQGKVGCSVGSEAITWALLMSLSVVLLPHWGTNAIGWAFLVANIGAALTVLPALLAILRLAPPVPWPAIPASCGGTE